MDGLPPKKTYSQNDQINAAIKAIREKPALPEIDFTLHTMEDGSTVSTQERVCKGTAGKKGLKNERMTLWCRSAHI